MTIRSDFELDVQSALDAVDAVKGALESALEGVAASFAEALTSALESVQTAAEITVVVDTAAAEQELAGLTAEAAAQSPTIAVGVDVTEADAAIADVRESAATQEVVVPVTAETGTLDEEIEQAVDRVEPPDIPIGADASAVGEAAAEAIAAVDETSATISVDAETTAFGDRVDEAIAEERRAEVEVDADVSFADASIGAFRDATAETAATVTLEAETGPAEAGIAEVTEAPEPLVVPVDAEIADAAEAIAEVAVDRDVTITAEAEVTAAEDEVNRLTEPLATTLAVEAETADAQAEVAAIGTEPLTIAVVADVDPFIEAVTDAIQASAETEVKLTEVDAQAVIEAVANAVEEGAKTPVELRDVDAAPIVGAIEDAIREGAVEPAVVTADAQAVTEAVEAAIVVAAAEPVVLEADASGLPARVEEALAETDATLVLDGDAAQMPGAIEAALDDADKEVPLEAEASEITTAIEGAVADADKEVPLEAGLEGLVGAIEEAVTDVTFVITPTIDVEEATGGIGDAVAEAITNAAATTVEISEVDTGPLTEAIVEAIEGGAETEVVLTEVDAGLVGETLAAAIDEGAERVPEVMADASDVRDEVTAAINDGAETPAQVTADTDPVTAAIDQAIEGADATLTVDVATENIPIAVEQAVADADAEVVLSADADAIGEAIGDAISEAIGASAETEVRITDVDAEAVTDAVVDAVEAGAKTPVELRDVDADPIVAAVEDAVQQGAEQPATVTAEAQGVTDTVGEAIAEAAAEAVHIDADASDLPDAVEAALAQTDATVELEGDAEQLPGAIEAALDDADKEVSLEAEASAVTEAVEGAIADADKDVPLEAGLEGLVGAVQEAITDASFVVAPTIDTEEVTEAIEGAIATAIVDAAATPVEISGVDTEPLADAVAGAVEDGAEAPAQVTADAEPVTAAIDQAVLDADATLAVDVDTEKIPVSVEEAIADTDVEVALEADASAITDAIGEAIAEASDTEAQITEVDASAVAEEVEKAIQEAAATPVVIVDVDAGAVVDAIDAAIQEGAETVAEITADTADVDAGIRGAIQDAAVDPIVVAVDADSVTRSVNDAIEDADAVVEVKGEADHVADAIAGAVEEGAETPIELTAVDTDAISAAIKTSAETEVEITEVDAEAVIEAIVEAIEKGAETEVEITEVDAEAVENAVVAAALLGAQFLIELNQVDASAVRFGIQDGIIEAADTPVEVIAETEGLAEAIIETAEEAEPVATIEADTEGIPTAITESISDANKEVPLEGDASDVGAVIPGAIDDANKDVPLDASGDAIESAIVSAIQRADTIVVIQADASEITQAIEEAAADADVAISVDATQAERSLEDLGESADSATAGVGGLGIATNIFAGTASTAIGNADVLDSVTEAMGESAKKTAVAFTALAVFIGASTTQAIQAESANRRFARSLGATADEVNALSIDGFADSLSDLALKTGNSDEAMRGAASSIADLGKSSGATEGRIGSAAETILLLATRTSVLRPELGQAGQLAENLTRALARGGPALRNYGLSITTADIAARALADSGKATTAELTLFDRSAAGAALAAAQLGEGLRTDIVEGSESSAIKLRSLKTSIEEALEAFGTPLVAPLVETIAAATPIAIEFGEIMGTLGESILPALVPLLKGISVAVQGIAIALGPLVTLFQAVPPVVISAAIAVIAYSRALALADKHIALFAGAQVLGMSRTSAFAGKLAQFAGPAGIGGFIGAVVAAKYAVEAFNLPMEDNSLHNLKDGIQGAEQGLIRLASALGVVGAAFSVSAGKGLGLKAILTALGTSGALKIAGPIGVAVTVGSVLGVFDSVAQQAKIATDELAESWVGATDNLTELEGRLKTSKTAITEFLKNQLQSKENAENTNEVLGKLEIGYGAMANALLGTNEEYQAFIQNTVDSAEAVGLEGEVIDKFLATLGTQRRALNVNAEAEVKQLLATKQLTDVQLERIKTEHGVNEATAGSRVSMGDWVLVLEDATALARENAEASGVQAANMDDLRRAILAGTEIDVQAWADRLHTGFEEVEGIVKSTKTELENFVSSTLGKLPSAADAFAASQEHVGSAVQQMGADVTAGAEEVAAGFNQIELAADPQRLIDQLEQQTQQILEFQSSIDLLSRAGLAKTVEFITTELGPQQGSALAAALVLDPAQAAAVEASLTSRTEAIYTTLADNLTNDIGPRTLAPAGDAAALQLTSGYSDNLSLADPTDAEIRAAVDTMRLLHPTMTKEMARTAVAADLAFAQRYHPAEAVDDGMAEAVDRVGTLGEFIAGASLHAGQGATDQFGEGTDFAGTVAEQGPGVAAAVTGIGARAGGPANASGYGLGQQLGTGVRSGINDSLGGTQIQINVATRDATKQLLAQGHAAQADQEAALSLFGALQGVTDAQESVASSAGSAGGATETAAQKAFAAEDKWRALRDAVVGVADADRGLIDSQRGVEDATRAHEMAQLAAKEAVEAHKDANKELAEAQRDAEAATADLAKEQENLNRVLRGFDPKGPEVGDAREEADDASRGVRGAQLDLKDAEDDLAKVRKNKKSTTIELARAELRYEEAVDRLEGAEKDATETTRVLDGTLHGFAETSKEAVEATTRVTEATEKNATAQERVVQQGKAVHDAYRAIFEAGRAVDEAFRGTETAALAVEAAYRATDDAASGLRHAVADLRGELDSPGGGGGGGAVQAANDLAGAYTSATGEIITFAERFADQSGAMKDSPQWVGVYISALEGIKAFLAPDSDLARFIDATIAGFKEQGLAGPAGAAEARTGMNREFSALTSEVQEEITRTVDAVDQADEFGFAGVRLGLTGRMAFRGSYRPSEEVPVEIQRTAAQIKGGESALTTASGEGGVATAGAFNTGVATLGTRLTEALGRASTTIETESNRMAGPDGPVRRNARRIGEAFDEGLIEGINSGLRGLETVAQFAAHHVNRAFVKEEEITSPSKVWRGFGEFMIQGLAEGLELTGPLAGAVSRLAQVAIPDFGLDPLGLARGAVLGNLENLTAHAGAAAATIGSIQDPAIAGAIAFERLADAADLAATATIAAERGTARGTATLEQTADALRVMAVGLAALADPLRSVGGLADDVPQAWAAMADKVAVTAGVLGDTGTQIAGSVEAGLANLSGRAAGTFRRMFSAIENLSDAEASAVRDQATAIGAAFVDALSASTVGDATVAFRSAFSDIDTLATDFTANLAAQAFRVGETFSSGLAAGIEHGDEAVEDAARAVSDAAERGVREQSETDSPSRVFFAVGRDIVDGLIGGLSDRPGVFFTIGTTVVRELAAGLAEIDELERSVQDRIIPALPQVLPAPRLVAPPSASIVDLVKPAQNATGAFVSLAGAQAKFATGADLVLTSSERVRAALLDRLSPALDTTSESFANVAFELTRSFESLDERTVDEFGRVSAKLAEIQASMAVVVGLAAAKIGEAFIGGMGYAMVANLNIIDGAGRAVAEAAIHGAKVAAGVASPSKVWRQIGLDMVEGLEEGLSQTSGIETAAARLSTLATPTLTLPAATVPTVAAAIAIPAVGTGFAGGNETVEVTFDIDIHVEGTVDRETARQIGDEIGAAAMARARSEGVMIAHNLRARVRAQT